MTGWPFSLPLITINSPQPPNSHFCSHWALHENSHSAPTFPGTILLLAPLYLLNIVSSFPPQALWCHDLSGWEVPALALTRLPPFTVMSSRSHSAILPGPPYLEKQLFLPNHSHIPSQCPCTYSSSSKLKLSVSLLNCLLTTAPLPQPCKFLKVEALSVVCALLCFCFVFLQKPLYTQCYSD